CQTKPIEMTTETFDIEKFEKNKVDGEYYYTLEDSTTVRQIESENEYIEYIMPPKPNLLEIYKQYYKSGEIQRYIISFPKDFLVLKKNYDKTGKLIEEIDYDKPFKFTFEQLVALLKKEKDTIDLYDKNTTIGRGSDEKGTDWYVTYKKVLMRREFIIINGITGEILERNFHLHLDN
ncbi:MAG: hypothetical protein L3J23_08410, partial [Flavobacteriaceae bacterium]|nr:hypothetical protein [Flavobacteriaceae bacterium]